MSLYVVCACERARIYVRILYRYLYMFIVSYRFSLLIILLNRHTNFVCITKHMLSIRFFLANLARCILCLWRKREREKIIFISQFDGIFILVYLFIYFLCWLVCSVICVCQSIIIYPIHIWTDSFFNTNCTTHEEQISGFNQKARDKMQCKWKHILDLFM